MEPSLHEIASASTVGIDALPVMAWTTDARGRVRCFNERWTRYVGHEAGMRPTWLSERYVHPDDFDRVRERWLAKRAVGNDLLVDLRIRRFDGMWRWHLLHASATRDSHDMISGWVGVCTDIDDQRRLERELTRRCTVLEAQGEASLDAIIVISPDRQLLWANTSARDLWGSPDDEVPVGGDMRAAAVRSAHRALDPAAHLEQLERIYADPEGVVRDDIAMADGRFMERFSAPVYAADGQLLGRVNTYRDVTKRIQLVGELERERTQLQATVEQVSSLVRTLERLASTASLTNDSRLGLRDLVAMMTDQARLLIGSISATTVLEGYPELDEIRMVTSPSRMGDDATPDPAGVLMSLRAPLITVEGTPLGRIELVGKEAGGETFTDADQSVLVQLAQMTSSAIQARLLMSRLQERAHASLALDFIADAVVLTNPDGVILLWNPAAARLTGIAADTAVGRRAERVLAGWSDMIGQVPTFDEGDPPRPPVSVPIDTPRGEVWISMTTVSFHAGCVHAFRDVTAEQRIDRLRSEIVATVSHELRTPVTSIYGMAVTLQRPDSEIDEEARSELLGVIVEQSSRLGAIIDDILVASRIEVGSIEVDASVVNVRDVARAVVDVTSVDAPGNLELEVRDELPDPLACGDPERLRQVLTNIVENAVKYSPDGGTIRVLLQEDADTISVHVSDEGLGIPPEEQARVFDKFHRLDPSMTRGIPGTGLGLYIARELTRRMGGDVTVRSAFSVGSTFTVRLPRPRTPSGALEPRDEIVVDSPAPTSGSEA
jgi:PAS domain S-box-containing protein